MSKHRSCGKRERYIGRLEDTARGCSGFRDAMGCFSGQRPKRQRLEDFIHVFQSGGECRARPPSIFNIVDILPCASSAKCATLPRNTIRCCRLEAVSSVLGFQSISNTKVSLRSQLGDIHRRHTRHVQKAQTRHRKDRHLSRLGRQELQHVFSSLLALSVMPHTKAGHFAC